MKDGPAFQCYAKDLLVSTAHMSPQAFGGYWRLICHQWDRGGLPDNTEILIALSGCDPDTIMEFRDKFETSKKDGLLRNKKLEKVRAEQRRFRASRSRNSVTGWVKRRKSDASALQVHSKCNALRTSDSVLRTPITTNVHKGVPMDEAQAVEWASMEMVPAEFAKEVYYQLQGRSWVDGAGQVVDDWRYHIKYRWIKRQGEKLESSTKGPSRERPLTPLDLKTIRDTKEAIALQLKERYAADGPMGMTWSDDSKRQEFIKIRSEIRTLNQRLSNFA